MRLGSRSRIEKTASVAPTKPAAKCSARRRLQSVRVREPERGQQQGRELRPARQRHGHAAGERRRAEPEAPHEERGHDRVVRVGVQRVRGEGEREPAEGERHSQSLPAEAPAHEEEAEDGDQVERDRRRMGSRKRIPLSVPEQDEDGRDVDDVGHRPVGVAAGVGGLAAAVRLDPVARRPLRVRRPARPAGVVDRHVAVRGLAVEQPVAADHARVAHVDDAVGILDVEPDAQAPEEDGDGGQQPHRPRERRVEGAAAEADPRGADREVRKRRRPQRGRAEHVALIEAPQREAERHEREQVQRVPGAQAPPVDQAEDEDDAERNPGPPCVQDLPAERADPAPGHAPGDLRAGPGLDHAAVGIGDLPERDLAGAPRPDLHLPQARGLVERRIGLRIRRVAVEPVRHLRIRRGSARARGARRGGHPPGPARTAHS